MGIENAFLILVIACGIISLGRMRRMSFSKDETLVLRGLLALIVVVGHCNLMKPGSPLMGSLHMATPAVSIFFFLSGYGLMAKSGKSVDGMVLRSVSKLFIPYFVAVMLWLFYLMVAGPGLCLQELLQNLARGESFPPHSWYVFALFLLYVAFACCSRRLKGGVACLAVTIVTAGFYVVLKLGLKWPFWWWCSLPSFAIGLWWRYYETEISGFLNRRMRGVGFGIFVIGLCLWTLFLKGFFPGACLLYSLGPLAALILYCAPKSVLGFTGLTFLGRISYEIYLFHCVPEHWLKPYISSPAIYCLAVIAVVFVLAVLYYKIRSIQVAYRGVNI